jgi:transcriptional regulator with XRE-family HTH domain
MSPRDVGRRIKERRELLEVTQERLAAQAGITQPTLSAIERGDTKRPEAVTILAIAAALRTSPYLLVYDHAPPAAMQHTVAALVDLWDRLDDDQRKQVVAYAQGLADAKGAKPTPLLEHKRPLSRDSH